MYRILKLVVLTMILNACVSDNDLITVNPSLVFHNNNSKVWLVNHKYKDGKDFSPLSLKYKEIIIFHKTGNFYMQKMNTLGDEIGQNGSFEVSNNLKKVKLDFYNQVWIFDPALLTNEKIILKPKFNYNYTLELIPIPEPR
jgi:hypothetical protein